MVEMYSEVVCESCKKVFTPTGARQKYCHPKCKNIVDQAKKNGTFKLGKRKEKKINPYFLVRGDISNTNRVPHYGQSE